MHSDVPLRSMRHGSQCNTNWPQIAASRTTPTPRRRRAAGTLPFLNPHAGVHWQRKHRESVWSLALKIAARRWFFSFVLLFFFFFTTINFPLRICRLLFCKRKTKKGVTEAQHGGMEGGRVEGNKRLQNKSGERTVVVWTKQWIMFASNFCSSKKQKCDRSVAIESDRKSPEASAAALCHLEHQAEVEIFHGKAGRTSKTKSLQFSMIMILSWDM